MNKPLLRYCSFYFLFIPGSFAPAGPNTIWKKRQAKDNNETKAYQELMTDTMRPFIPRFYREVDYNGECILFIRNR